ncbi:hypothetical protein CBM2629_A170168 [Cupriavidus taiwanensis]|nr:hypothetical protein CBM2629_A170168 [Cupriavidus taiwanensis]
MVIRRPVHRCLQPYEDSILSQAALLQVPELIKVLGCRQELQQLLSRRLTVGVHQKLTSPTKVQP